LDSTGAQRQASFSLAMNLHIPYKAGNSFTSSTWKTQHYVTKVSSPLMAHFHIKCHKNSSLSSKVINGWQTNGHNNINFNFLIK